MLSKEEILTNDLEKFLSFWVLDFQDYFSDLIEENAKFLELRPNCFFI
jgi:hypothetical protein